MATPISSSPHVQPQTTSQSSAARQAAQPAKKQKAHSTDTVTISTAARTLQQRIEAPTQTVEAAASGDVQAKSQLTKPAAAPTASK